MLTRIPERIAAATHEPTAGCDLRHLTNDELFAGTRRLVGASNQVFAMLLAHLAEVETRGLHRERACSSLYTYCIYELRFSEDAAFRRVSASRLVKRFPVLYEAIASGELHLTGLVMLGPHLTPENHLEVLARAKHRTKTELSKLLRTLDPFPDLPARIEPLAPAPAPRTKTNPSWGDYIAAWAPVRELGEGDAPRDWMNDDLPRGALAEAGNEQNQPALARPEILEPIQSESEGPGAALAGPDFSGPALARPGALGAEGTEPAPARSGPHESASVRPDELGAESSEPAPARPDRPVTGPLRYGVQFSADEEYVLLVERAKALLSSAHGKSSLEEIHLRALRLLVADLEKRRFAKTARPRTEPETVKCSASESERSNASDEPGGASAAKAPGTTHQLRLSKPRSTTPRTRYIPAAVRREVFERDAARCTFVDSTGQRCRETHGLELHHLLAFAQGGEHKTCNLTLRCRAHNAFAAEADFGRDFMAKKRGETA